MIEYRICQTNPMDTNFHREAIRKRITKIRIRLVVRRNVIIITIIDQSARLRLDIVRKTVMMIVRNGQNTRNDEDRRRVNVNVAIRRARNQVDQVSTHIMIETVRHPVTEAVEVQHIQAPNTSHGRVHIREIAGRIIGISLNSMVER